MEALRRGRDVCTLTASFNRSSINPSSEFFIDNYDQWKNDYPKAKEIFEKGIQAEIDLWGTALSPGS